MTDKWAATNPPTLPYTAKQNETKPQGKMTMENMHEDGQEPGDFGFDPLKLSSKPAAVREKYQLQEIKNGRLAMSAIGGLVHQSLLLHGGVPFHA